MCPPATIGATHLKMSLREKRAQSGRKKCRMCSYETQLARLYCMSKNIGGKNGHKWVQGLLELKIAFKML